MRGLWHRFRVFKPSRNAQISYNREEEGVVQFDKMREMRSGFQIAVPTKIAQTKCSCEKETAGAKADKMIGLRQGFQDSLPAPKA